jgi:ornithine cyclodeaminase/alanine dehydrogenase-like protein (mu-crystallin family)
MIQIIEDSEVRQLVRREEAVEIIERAYKSASLGRAGVSKPSSVTMASTMGHASTFKMKGAILDEMGIAGFRLIADSNRMGVPDSSYVYLMRIENVSPYALVAEQWLHRMRTAVSALVACRHMAPEGASTLALIGTGRIAEEFLRILSLYFPKIAVLLASRSGIRAQQAAERWNAMVPNEVGFRDTVAEAVAEADIVVTVSDADERLFQAQDLKPRVLVCALGGNREFDIDVLGRADHFIVDEIDFVCNAGSGKAWLKSGQTTRPRLESLVSATLGEVLLGTKPVPQDGIVLAIIQGMAICDVALAHLAYTRKLGGTV